MKICISIENIDDSADLMNQLQKMVEVIGHDLLENHELMDGTFQIGDANMEIFYPDEEEEAEEGSEKPMTMNRALAASRQSFKTAVSKKGTFTAAATAAYNHIQQFNSTILLVHDGEKWQAWARNCEEWYRTKALRTDEPGIFFEHNLTAEKS